MQTSNISNKPASIALNYHERMERINQEWYEHLEKQYLMLDEEICFFERHCLPLVAICRNL